MANDNFYPGQTPAQPIGTGEGESPLAKPVVPNMDVRTMSSDLQSINTGTPAPKPYAPQATSPMSPMTPAAPVSDFKIPEMAPADMAPMDGAPKKSNKGVFTALIVFILVIGLAALGYFVIYPIFFSGEPAPVVDNTATPPTASLPTPEPTPEPLPPNPSEPVSTPAPTHVSLFTIPADSQIDAATVTTGAALSTLTLSATAPSLSEIIYKNSSGGLTSFVDILKGVGIDVSENSTLASAFDDRTATGLVYADGSARWLGFAAELASGADAQAVSAAFKQVFESVTDYGTLFAGAPGATQTWKDGQISGVMGNRYLLFGNSGFAIDYGWVGNKLVVLTSYNGFKEAVRRVQ